MRSSLARLVLCSAALGTFVGACRTAAPAAPPPQPLPPVAAPPVAPMVQAPPPPVPVGPTVTDDGRAVDVDLQVEALVGDAPPALVTSGQRLKSGDRLAVHVIPNANAYVAVALVSSDGEPQLLFPTQGPGILTAGVVERIPAPGKWFRLDKSAGREDIFVYAAKRPLDPADILAKVKVDGEAARQASKSASKGPKKASGGKTGKHGAKVAENDAPGAITSDTRALELVDETPPQSAVTKKRFSIKHEK